MAALAAPPAGRRGDPHVLISVVAAAAAVAVALTAHDAWRELASRPWTFVAFLGLWFGLQLVTVEVHRGGRVSFGGAAILALGIVFGPGPAMLAAALGGLVNLARTRGRLNRVLFDAAQYTLAAGAASAVYHAGAGDGWSAGARVGPAFAAGATHLVVNSVLLCVAIGLAEGVRPTAVWHDRFRWFAPYHLASGPLGLALAVAYEKLGATGLVAIALPSLLMMLSVRQSVARTRAAAEEVARANVELEQRNADLHDLLELSSGLGARAHDLGELVAYVERSLGELAGAHVRVDLAEGGDGIPLGAGGAPVARLAVSPGAELDAARWERLRGTVLPHVATALESAQLGERMRAVHRDTIASLSRSMEAKDYYTGGHTERVAELAVALAARLGYGGGDLEAIEIGALLHDIGKIGIPEAILHKPGPLDRDEWRVMQRHPVISDTILAEIDLHPFVRQIARWSHERIDGAGYPDALGGEQIPLPARIVFVADAFDALTSDRPYRRARHAAAALAELRRHAGTQFCAGVVDTLESLLREQPELAQDSPLHLVGGAGVACAARAS